jgi:hypothetical protein
MSWLLSKRLRQSIVGDLPSFKMKTWWEPSKTVVATTQNYGSNTEPAARLPATSTKYLIANKKMITLCSLEYQLPSSIHL